MQKYENPQLALNWNSMDNPYTGPMIDANFPRDFFGEISEMYNASTAYDKLKTRMYRINQTKKRNYPVLLAGSSMYNN